MRSNVSRQVGSQSVHITHVFLKCDFNYSYNNSNVIQIVKVCYFKKYFRASEVFPQFSLFKSVSITMTDPWILFIHINKFINILEFRKKFLTCVNISFVTKNRRFRNIQLETISLWSIIEETKITSHRRETFWYTYKCLCWMCHDRQDTRYCIISSNIIGARATARKSEREKKKKWSTFIKKKI